MSTGTPKTGLEDYFEAAAQAYLRRLKLDNHREAIPQATQRAITVACFGLVHLYRPDIQCFNELLVQRYTSKRRKPVQVVPDNMVVVHHQPIQASGHYSIEQQPVVPFLVMEYVSNSNRRKDYAASMQKYESDLPIPYYLRFYPDNQELSLFRHDGTKYASVLPDEEGRHPIPELDVEVTLMGGWVRYFFRGQLLRLPGDLQRTLDRTLYNLQNTQQNLDMTLQHLQAEQEARKRAEEELVRLKAELAALRRQA